ncbi:5-(carboxyamino)imidazole ribonucleotide mutase [Methanoregula formicica]|uniref:N5-carboxyaminoimidazole ribonucleotide mutase n=1 Tax=Methanoregula formicica (strain DSM 22288 / NBRC 105244 / SMSP) TaxID=593750 RepID=L0HBN2_METFS|nr:AIR carboxylase family protein [Methanoregula formicica]AGB01201.1 phosphoribosylcarboxyaminoimidazole (NCAIR) mutase [Methanoregula formicica SMSP]
MADVAIVSGSASDAAITDKVRKVLDANGITYDAQILSAHRDPDKLDAYIKTCDAKIYIAIAGLSAALPGVIASKTDKPVIGVPVAGTLNGMDALLSIAQMPKGVPVACVGVDNGDNAAWLAIRILKLVKK